MKTIMAKKIPPAVFFYNNNRCPLRSYEMDPTWKQIMKWKRTGQLHTAESVPILHLYQALQLQNNWGQKGSQENPQAKQKLSWRISWLCYKTITDQLKNPQTNIFKWSYIHPWAFCIVFDWNGQMLHWIYMCPAFLIDLSPHSSQVKSFSHAFFFSMVSPWLLKQRKKTIYLTATLI